MVALRSPVMATFVYPLCFAIGALCTPGTVFCWLPILIDPGWTR